MRLVTVKTEKQGTGHGAALPPTFPSAPEVAAHASRLNAEIRGARQAIRVGGPRDFAKSK